MRLVVARCTVVYEGRLVATLPEHTRLLMVKADGCVAIHSDGGAYKPLNWMNAPNTVREDMQSDGTSGQWTVSNPKGETLHITLHHIYSDSAHDLGVDPGLQKEGVEAELQVLLSERTDMLAPGLTLVRREYPTEIGPVDLLCKDANGVTVAVEIKRRGEIDGVEQLTRYVEFLNRDPMLTPVRGMFVAQEIKPQAKVLATDRGIAWVEVDYDELRDRPSNVLRLF
jgi:endonuclease